METFNINIQRDYYVVKVCNSYFFLFSQIQPLHIIQAKHFFELSTFRLQSCYKLKPRRVAPGVLAYIYLPPMSYVNINRIISYYMRMSKEICIYQLTHVIGSDYVVNTLIITPLVSVSVKQTPRTPIMTVRHQSRRRLSNAFLFLETLSLNTLILNTYLRRPLMANRFKVSRRHYFIQI